MKGVYFHTERHKQKALSYATFAPIFGDGTFIRVILECDCDLNYRKVYKHQDQKIQTANGECDPVPGEEYKGGPSVFYKYLLVQHVGYQDLPHDATYNVIWNPGLEARPDHINKLHGFNNKERVCLVVFPPAEPRKSKAKKEAAYPAGSVATQLISCRTGLAKLSKLLYRRSQQRRARTPSRRRQLSTLIP